jgi:signal transduction histidine kinase
MSKIFNCLFFCCIGLYAIPTKAQPAKVDSVINLLRASNKKNGVDTALFLTALRTCGTAVLTDAEIKRIDLESDRFTRGKNEDTSFYIRMIIADCIDDISKHIDYCKMLFDKIEKSETPKKDILLNNLLFNLRVQFRNSSRLSEGFLYYNNWLIQFKQQNDSTGIAVCNFVLASFYNTIGLSNKAIYHFKTSLTYLDSSKHVDKFLFDAFKLERRELWLINIGALGEVYLLMHDIKNGLIYTKLAFQIQQKEGRGPSGFFVTQNLAQGFLLNNDLDSAAFIIKLAYDSCKKNDENMLPVIFQTWSMLELKKQHFDKADSLLVKAWEIINEKKIPTIAPQGNVDPDYYRALIRIEQNKYAEAANFIVSDIERIKNLRNETIRDYKLLAEVYDKMGDAEKSKENYKKYISLQDSLLADQRKLSNTSFEAEQQMNEKEISINQLKSENKISALTRNFSFGIIALVLLLSGVIYYRYKSKQKANAVLEKTLSDLKSTQTQLIQAEKMASLGELTAGIAHEIQNPLNFVNNFSEVSTELLAEMKIELDVGKFDVAKEIANDVIQNLEKINHHGKRADAIVKGMLQHSRSSSSVKEPTDINALCDEYLRLSYHGLRAKDKLFNATLNTSYDSSIGSISIIAQDIGRVLLNLFNNAFYAVAEKQRTVADDYQPTVSISTKKNSHTIELTVSDNGNGIPEKIKDKIFNPFFTTKPTGQGTGLGLSLSYDIIKAHGGEIKVETKEGEGSTFIIKLPV